MPITITLSDMYQLFIDDERFPADKDIDRFVIARTSAEAIELVKMRGIPVFISFDHDLGGDDTSMKFLYNLMDHVLDNGLKFPKDFSYYVHSQNPIGAKNISAFMDLFIMTVGKEEI